jgi:hypothetical protein
MLVFLEARDHLNPARENETLATWERCSLKKKTTYMGTV